MCAATAPISWIAPSQLFRVPPTSQTRRVFLLPAFPLPTALSGTTRILHTHRSEGQSDSPLLALQDEQTTAPHMVVAVEITQRVSVEGIDGVTIETDGQNGANGV